MSDLERMITVWSLVVVVVFYAVTIFFFIIADKSRLNYSLAVQKVIWLVILGGIAIPAYSDWYPTLPHSARAFSFLALAVVTLWVLAEVYRSNRGMVKPRLLRIIGHHREATGPEMDRREGSPRRREPDVSRYKVSQELERLERETGDG